MVTRKNNFLKLIFILVISLLIGSIFILIIGENPIDAYIALLKGAFGTRLGMGNTIASWTPLILTTMAFTIGAQVGAFNVGVEGEVILGAITAAYIGINRGFLPVPLLFIACFLGAMIVGGLWALIPALLKVFYNVSEVCVTILMNTVAVYIASYLVSGPMSAGTANPQTKPVLIRIPKIMKPSTANAGIFIALIIFIIILFVIYKTKYGLNIRAVGLNAKNSDYLGVDSKKIYVSVFVLSGVLAGIAGCIEVLGVYGYYLDGFALGLGTNGMLASLIVRSNPILSLFTSFFLAVLKSGSMVMQQSTAVPKSIVDTFAAIFIIIATMDFEIKRIKKRKNIQKSQTNLENETRISYENNIENKEDNNIIEETKVNDNKNEEAKK